MSNFTPPVADTAIGRQFAEDGFYLAKGVFSGAELAALQKDFDQIVAQLLSSGEDVNARWGGAAMDKLGAANTVILHTHNVQQYSAAWMRGMMAPAFLDIATSILGPDVILHHSKLFQKPAEVGAPFPMHQDYGYFPTELDSMIAGIVHVSDATDEMGCLRVYPGSHKRGRMEDSQGHDLGYEAEFPLERATIVEAEAGDVLFFHYFTVHGSMPNRSDRVRKTVLIQLHAGNDAMEEGYPHPYEKLVLAGFNHRATRGNVNAIKG